MLDLGWSELLVIGIVALIVVGPKDLPVLFRNVGRFMGKARGMAREFTRAMNDAADESGVRDVAKTFKTATNPMGSAMDGVKDAARAMTDPTPEKKKEGLKEDPNALDPEREAAKKRIEASAARSAADRQRREAEAAQKRAEESAAKAAELEASLKKDGEE
ncbi:Sec-independent protein translocase protein TatB [Salipiger bermudensis]|uniref:Sec-independent protein translocase protein TatB n=1 Tax=Salipiger bermudensis (strain DSM 26914 / JCM 13377 / KCTC 12554 / HTCC2601) TaxID=314265 RepID=Q0FTM9_SALBH|nr:Sec-independent protein translocase protein TatB [Salipiger bermudensis]MAE92835.1 twin-arginine translocase subunit TatB [Pelagibaca sp.]MBR9891588.1 twin-arginine translocase subunit TatB [bacterium]EAU47423.1 twin-arginine translocation protein TatB [Salipiger bermudensis HTCC2601]MBN9674947.1 twin-arginine translocase subunit TatB [Salipiger bermudensis]MCA1284530.1 Sec-independent protein translocase protein TatB [Salipiger bermudensis]